MAQGDPPRDIGAEAVGDVDDLDLLRRRLGNVIGHALRTPTATVRGQAEILARTSDPQVRQEAIAALLRTSRRLEEMIDEVLVVQGLGTRLPTGGVQRLDLAAEVRAVATDLEVVEEVELAGEPDVTVSVGRDALRWVLRSVLDNAGRYGTGPVRVEVTTRADGTRLEVSTPGGGVGATDDDVRLAFEPFYRGERAVTVTATRLGLGLTAARGVIEALGGHIGLERDEERGIITHVELPSA